jgi:hypothetical protein
MTIELSTHIQDRLRRVQEQIEIAAQSSGRNPVDVQLVVVTKAQPLEVVQAAIVAGASILGENYAEEAAAKMASLGGKMGVNWHMIGHVQSRKARVVCEHFDLVHSLDSLRLAERYNQFSQEIGRVLPVLIEFNLGGEESKSGWSIGEADSLDPILPDLEQVVALPAIRVMGLMTMPPLFDDPQETRPYFVRLRKIQERLRRRMPSVDWGMLSMGTSADFAVAVQEGATLVRVGRAIVGPRPRRV